MVLVGSEQREIREPPLVLELYSDEQSGVRATFNEHIV